MLCVTRHLRLFILVFVWLVLNADRAHSSSAGWGSMVRSDLSSLAKDVYKCSPGAVSVSQRHDLLFHGASTSSSVQLPRRLRPRAWFVQGVADNLVLRWAYARVHCQQVEVTAGPRLGKCQLVVGAVFGCSRAVLRPLRWNRPAGDA